MATLEDLTQTFEQVICVKEKREVIFYDVNIFKC